MAGINNATATHHDIPAHFRMRSAKDGQLKKAFDAETGISASTFDRTWRDLKETAGAGRRDRASVPLLPGDEGLNKVVAVERRCDFPDLGGVRRTHPKEKY